VLPDLDPGPSAGRERLSADRLAYWLFVAACALGVLRLLGLGSCSLWLDEALTLADSRHRESAQNPLGYFLLGLFYDLSSQRPNEFLLRLPSALFGWIAIPLTFWTFRPLVGQRVAAAAALIVSLSTWHLYWSQNARFYTLAQALGLLGGGLLLRGVLRSSAPRVLLGAAITALSALAHPSAALLALGLIATPWLLRFGGWFPEAWDRPALWRALGAICLVGAFFGSGWLLDVWVGWRRRRPETSTMHLLLTSGYFVTPAVGLATLWGAWLLWRERRRETYLLLGVVALPLLGALLASLRVRVSAQYVFVLLPWIAAVAAYPVSTSEPPPPGRRRPRGLQTVRAASLFLGFLLLPGVADSTLYFGLRHGDRPHWREAYRYVFEHRRETDMILGMDAPVGEYYLNPDKDDLRRWSTVTWLDRFRAKLPGYWARYPRRIWFVINFELLEDWPAADRREMRRVLEQECRPMRHFPVPLTPRDLDVWVFLRE
jgi:hypothetical protein